MAERRKPSRWHDVSEARLAAYLASQKTIKSLAPDAPKTTIGDIVDETLIEVEEACAKGRLGVEIFAFERDPDEWQNRGE